MINVANVRTADIRRFAGTESVWMMMGVVMDEFASPNSALSAAMKTPTTCFFRLRLRSLRIPRLRIKP